MPDKLCSDPAMPSLSITHFFFLRRRRARTSSPISPSRSVQSPVSCDPPIDSAIETTHSSRRAKLPRNLDGEQIPELRPPTPEPNPLVQHPRKYSHHARLRPFARSPGPVHGGRRTAPGATRPRRPHPARGQAHYCGSWHFLGDAGNAPTIAGLKISLTRCVVLF